MSIPPLPKMLLLRNSPTSVFMASAPTHLEVIKPGDMKKTLNLLIWKMNSGRSVHKNISRSVSSNPRMSLSSDHADSEGQTTASASPMRRRRTHGNFTDSNCRNSNFPLVSGKNDDYKYSSLQLGPNGVPLLCTARGCRVANVSETEYMSRGSGIERRGGNCETAEYQNSKKNRDMYYQRMLEANPGNPLLLRNYAKFLHEVQHDIAKAEEYYRRAILTSPDDAEVLSLYAKFTWETHNDAARAETYFGRAVKAAPHDDCYVLSSYAHFLWNSEEEEDQNDGSADLQNEAAITCVGICICCGLKLYDL